MTKHLFADSSLSLFAVVIVLTLPIHLAHGQIGAPPGVNDFSPTTDTDVSSTIMTGCGYDAWTGAARRSVVDLEVPGAIGGYGLKWTRNYSSSGVLWSFA